MTANGVKNTVLFEGNSTYHRLNIENHSVIFVQLLSIFSEIVVALSMKSVPRRQVVTDEPEMVERGKGWGRGVQSVLKDGEEEQQTI